MIVKIGGCNGSGKTSLMRAMMAQLEGWKPEYWKGDSGKVKLYSTRQLPLLLQQHFDRVVVLGDYRNVCGGMDTISDKEVRLAMVSDLCVANKANQRTLVLYEGLITGKTYGAMGALSDNCSIPWLYVFMDTPFDVCVQRVLARRKDKGNAAPFDPERTMRPTFKSCLSVAIKAAAQGHKVWNIDHKLKAVTAASNLYADIVAHATWEAKRAR